jgi:hypothetical protein
MMGMPRMGAAVAACLLVLPSALSVSQIMVPGADHASALQTLAGALSVGDSSGAPVKCAFPLIAEARRRHGALTPGAEGALAVLNMRPVTQTSIVRGRFSIHFDTTGANAPALLDVAHLKIPGSSTAFAESVASILAYVYDVEITQMGFDPPPQDGNLGGGPEYDVYITNLASYGYTDFDETFASGGTSTTFVVIDNTFAWVNPAANRGLPALRVTLAHEFHHMVQVGRYGYWFDDQWFYELTSTWLEDIVYTGVNDYYNYVKSLTGHFYRPETPLTESSGILMYSRCILGMFLTKQYGGSAMRTVWEKIRTEPPLPALRHVLPSSYNTAFTDAFGLWNAWNAYTNSRNDSVRYYPEGNAYPLIKETLYEVAPTSSRTVQTTLGSPGACYYRINSGTKSLFLGFSYAGSGTDDGSTSIPLGFTISNSRLDDSYKSTSAGLFVSYPDLDAGSWTVWDLTSGIPVHPEHTGPIADQGSVFPNPFTPGRHDLVHFLTSERSGLVSVYTPDMVKVYEGSQDSGTFFGKRAFTWNGRGVDGQYVASGIYLFVLSAGPSKILGKFSVVTK